ncbi:hypothetical protein QWY75_06105 [Pontixanthobacter aestiaquae]|uniref:DUF3137 domain-containing protein n=1 Tax=Pontixanthobacter aestiaquae TaxID=1509367 RepID=A0A844Z3G3_9SPHN|nr:hypothetical protein [Pontixanthobacter aestiaquae]MDN3645774.1 hypothetical protein [Pontixanthobacter aestiaquae]MXO83231.1 hypothetical protein [Pontixanthobacter aestiaquae]
MTSYCQDQHQRREEAVEAALTISAKRAAQVKRRAFDGLLATFIGLAVTAGFYFVNADSLWQLPATISGLAALYTWHNVLLFGSMNDVQLRAISAVEGGGFTVEQTKQSTPLGCKLKVILEPTTQTTAHLWDESCVADQIDADDATTFAWTPSGTFAAIELPQKPQGKLVLADYQTALAKRIDRLVALENEQAARKLLKQVERIENTVAIDDLSKFGQAFVSGSEWLIAKVQFPSEGVSVEGLEHDPQLLAFLRDDDCLEAFLNGVYAGHEDYEMD